MSYLTPMQTELGGIDNMASVAFDEPTFSPPRKIVGIRSMIYDLNMDNNSERPTFRLKDSGGLQTTGYEWDRWTKTHGSTYSQAVKAAGNNDTWIDLGTGLSNLGIVWGYYEAHLVDAATDLWHIYGKFRDDASADLTEVEIHGRIALDDECTGFRIASGNASTWSAGTHVWKAWR